MEEEKRNIKARGVENKEFEELGDKVESKCDINNGLKYK